MNNSSEIDDSVTKLCIGKFLPLYPYFDGITLHDIGDFDEEDLIDLIPRPHKLITIVFIKQKLKPYLNKGADPFLPNGYNYCRDRYPLVIKDGRLDINHAITWHIGRLSSYSPEQLLEDILKMDPEIRATVTYINLHSNNIEDENMCKIKTIIALFPKCTTIDLSFNMIKSCDEDILQLTNDNCIVIIANNPITGSDRKDFWKVRSNEELNKFIWIPRMWLQSNSWHCFVQDDQIELVYQVHKSYYQS